MTGGDRSRVWWRRRVGAGDFVVASDLSMRFPTRTGDADLSLSLVAR